VLKREFFGPHESCKSGREEHGKAEKSVEKEGTKVQKISSLYTSGEYLGFGV